MKQVNFKGTPKVKRTIRISFVTPSGKRVNFTKTEKIRKPIHLKFRKVNRKEDVDACPE